MRGAERGRILGGFYEAQARGGVLLLSLPRADERINKKNSDTAFRPSFFRIRTVKVRFFEVFPLVVALKH